MTFEQWVQIYHRRWKESWSSSVNPFLHFTSENMLRTLIPQKEQRSTGLQWKRQNMWLVRSNKSKWIKAWQKIWMLTTTFEARWLCETRTRYSQLWWGSWTLAQDRTTLLMDQWVQTQGETAGRGWGGRISGWVKVATPNYWSEPMAMIEQWTRWRRGGSSGSERGSEILLRKEWYTTARPEAC